MIPCCDLMSNEICVKDSLEVEDKVEVNEENAQSANNK
jgi:hypothetical protein